MFSTSDYVLFSKSLARGVLQRLLYLQVKEDILTDELFCPPETSVLLASYALQAKFGDYSVHLRESGRLFSDRLLPKRCVLYASLKLEKLNSL